ncbi:S8 family serine peptidase [Nitrospiraceae bacterium AH_259_D15_M11_P09]|nr:S8 family serine peptidase [Nitrospiraceae bacterium AH_259_D15_M11_P09]
MKRMVVIATLLFVSLAAPPRGEGGPESVLSARVQGVQAEIQYLRSRLDQLREQVDKCDWDGLITIQRAVEELLMETGNVSQDIRGVRQERFVDSAMFRDMDKGLYGVQKGYIALGDEVRNLIDKFEENCQKEAETAGRVAQSDSGEAGQGEAGQVVDKGELSITDQLGNVREATVMRLPKGEGEAPVVVGDQERINDGDDYIVAATCSENPVVSGRDLNAQGGIALKPKPRAVFIHPCAGPDDALEKAKTDLASKGIQFDPAKAEVREWEMDVGRFCEVIVREWQPAAGATAPRCRGTPTTESTPTPVAAGNDEVGIDDFPPLEPSGKPDTSGTPGTSDSPGAPGTGCTTQDPCVDTGTTGHTKPAVPRPFLPFPDDPYFHSRGSWGQTYPDQWGLHRIGFSAVKEGRSRSLWPAKAEPVVVAVIDSGVDRFHPELLGALWLNEGEVPGNGEDDDNNGYVDDLYGWNFIGNNNDTSDLNGHGTVLAGIIAAWTGNGVGIAGVNPWARIMAVKVVEWNGDAFSLDVANGIRYAVDNGARVINISVGWEGLRLSEWQAVGYARSKGVIVVVASGNEGANTNNSSPAGLPGVITVAATDTKDKRVGYSNWGPGVDIAAPGVDILSLRARRTDLLKFERESYQPGTAYVGKGKKYYRVTGTSFSAPYVAGVASLILSMHPELTGKEVTRMVLHSARDIDVPGWDQFTGYGLLDARAALQADPNFYALSRIDGVKGVRKAGKFFIQVSGRAMADKFARAWIEAGKGKSPTEWKKVSEDIAKPVNRGVLALIRPRHFRGSAEWMLRLIVEHENGFRREAGFDLKIG